MKKIIIAEVAVLLVLAIAAVGIGITAANTPVPTLPNQLQTQPPTEVPTQAPTLPPTEPPTEPPTQPPTQPPTEPPTQPPQVDIATQWGLYSKKFFVYDCAAETFLMTYGESQRLYPASITKLFSAYVALKYVDPETVITAGNELDLVAADSSKAQIQKGHRLKASMLIEGMMLPSGNDAAYILAVAAARAYTENPDLPAAAAIATFAQMMNETAADVGLTGSHFVNPDGYHADDHYTSFTDLVVIAKLALADPVISKYTATATEKVRYESGETIEWTNTNLMVNPTSTYYLPNALGLKTGSTSSAGQCLLSAFQVAENRVVIFGVFGGTSRNGRFADTIRLYQELVH